MDSNLKLTNPDTAAQFDTVEPSDYRVLAPGLYKGLLSQVPPDVAAILVDKQGYKRLVRKAVKPAAAKTTENKETK